MILRRYTNANGDQQEICLSKEDWEKVTEESLDIMLGFKAVAPAKPAKAAKAEPAPAPAPEPVVEAAPEPMVEEAPAVEAEAPAEKK
jgi:hypothetical protein